MLLNPIFETPDIIFSTLLSCSTSIFPVEKLMLTFFTDGSVFWKFSIRFAQQLLYSCVFSIILRLKKTREPSLCFPVLTIKSTNFQNTKNIIVILKILFIIKVER
mgnify:CR=1 FL=1